MISANENLLLVLILGLALTFVIIFGTLIFRQKRRRPQVTASQKTDADGIPASTGSVTLPQPRLEKVSEKIAIEDEFVSSTNLKSALAQTEKAFWGRLKGVFSNDVSKKHMDELEEVLYTSDLGPQTVQRLLSTVETELSRSEKSDINSIRSCLKDEFENIFTMAHVAEPQDFLFSHLNMQEKPAVWMIVGVNGAGKTTTIGKLAAHLAKNGKKVLVAAGDTFRAAAGNQLKAWTDRAQVEIFSPEGVSDPSAVAFDALAKAKAKAQDYDVVIIDTAGRLHTQANLMEELKKVKRVLAKLVASAPHETLIVLDANSGQNALIQAKEFHNALGLTGAVLTKMDGTAKGGVAVGLSYELKIPIRLIGIGEKIGDLRAFSSKEFISSILQE